MAKVRNGRLVVDTPTDLPEGAEVELVPIDGWDGLDDDERERLHASIERGLDDLEAGRTVPAAEVLRELRQRHK